MTSLDALHLVGGIEEGDREVLGEGEGKCGFGRGSVTFSFKLFHCGEWVTK